MAAKDPKARRRAASIAANVQWAKTPNRTERLAAARAKSPLQFEFHLAKVKAEFPDMRPADQRKNALNAYRAYQQQMSARRKKKTAEQQDESAA